MSTSAEIPSTASRVVIAGGSGFLGTSLATHLASRGHAVTVLTRMPPITAPRDRRFVHWDARTFGDWSRELNGSSALINLTGRSVDCIKTPEHRDEILRSRVESTRILGEACRAAASPPPVWVQMSTAHIYGDPPTARCDENSPTGVGLAPEVGRAWEEAFTAAMLPAQRGVVLRTSFVVGRRNAGGAGALGTLAPLARFGLGGRVGTGTQGMSWIHERDLHAIIDRALADPTMRGVYNITSPNPVPQHEFMRTLRRHAGGLGALGIALPAPAPLVRLGAPLVLRTDPELAIYGRYVVPTRLISEGFNFSFPTLNTALANLFTPSTR